jgi:hypothetical protein
MKPRLFLGERAGNRLMRTGVGYSDVGEPYDLLVRPNPIAPSDVGGENAFFTAHIPIVFSIPFTARVTPVLDGIPFYDESVAIENVNTMSLRERHVFECRFKKTFHRDGHPVAFHALRGTWFTVEIGLPCPMEGEGDFILEGVEIEHDIVSASRGAQ